MKTIKFNVKNILPQLTQVVSVVNSKNTMSILDSVKLETFEDDYAGIKLKMTASDSETWIVEYAKVDGDLGVCVCVDAQDFLKGLRNLDCDSVEMIVDEEKNIITCNYQNGYFSLTINDAKDFPKNAISEENTTSLELNPQTLLFFISNVGFAMNNDELRPVFNSIHFDISNEKMISVATDGQRLAKLTEYKEQKVDGITSFNLPSKPSSLIVGILASCEKNIFCKFNNNMIVFENDNFNFSTRLIEGKYPNYDSAIPTTYNYQAIVNKKSLLSAIRRVATMGNNTSELIKLGFENNVLVVSAENVDFGKCAKERLECEFNYPEQFEIGFKSSYLLQSLQNVDCDTIKLKLLAHNKACVIEPTKISDVECKYLLMPLAIN